MKALRWRRSHLYSVGICVLRLRVGVQRGGIFRQARCRAGELPCDRNERALILRHLVAEHAAGDGVRAAAGVAEVSPVDDLAERAVVHKLSKHILSAELSLCVRTDGNRVGSEVHYLDPGCGHHSQVLHSAARAVDHDRPADRGIVSVVSEQRDLAAESGRIDRILDGRERALIDSERVLRSCYRLRNRLDAESAGVLCVRTGDVAVRALHLGHFMLE